ncbi:unnamed protein product, partial [Vitis vinifera]
MDKEENYSAALPASFTGLDYTLNQQQQQEQLMKPRIGESSDDNNHGVVDYMLSNPQHQQLTSSGFCSSSFDKLSFADVMQFADFGPKLALNQTKVSEEETGIDPRYDDARIVEEIGEGEDEEENTSVQLQFLGENLQKNTVMDAKNKRKRPRTIKTSEEVESQRMTHIAVERNRRKQMNEHLRVLRSLMPSSYVQRGDQASIIGGAIEFVRELEQLLQCLESQKRRRLFGDAPRQMGDSSSLAIQQPQQPPFFPPLPLPNDQINFGTGLREETAENKSCLADVEVRLLGFDAMIKILSRRRPGQLIKTIAALEDLQLNILHTNITTIEQTVLYSFNVKIASESRFTAEDIASSVQQILSFIHANSSI